MATVRSSTTAARLFLLAGLVSLIVSQGRAEVPLPELPLDRGRLVERYDLSFRNSHYDYQSIRVEGSGVQISLVKPTINGLRVHVPPKTNGSGVGLCTKFGIRGDFELSVSYEILDAPKPSEGPGIGPEVSLQSSERWDEHISLSRRVAAKTGDATFSSGISRSGNLKTSGDVASVKSSSKVGRLYIARSSSTVYLYAAEGNGGFQKVTQTDFGTGNVMFVRLSTLYEGENRGLDVLWKDLTIRAESLPRNPGQPSDGAFPSVLLVAGLCVLLCIIAVIVGTYFYRRSRS